MRSGEASNAGLSGAPLIRDVFRRPGAGIFPEPTTETNTGAPSLLFSVPSASNAKVMFYSAPLSFPPSLPHSPQPVTMRLNAPHTIPLGSCCLHSPGTTAASVRKHARLQSSVFKENVKVNHSHWEFKIYSVSCVCERARETQQPNRGWKRQALITPSSQI